MPNATNPVRIQNAVRQLGELTTGCIDASTLIYTEKAGFIAPLAGSVKLVATQQNLAEVGPVSVPVWSVEDLIGTSYLNLSPDESILGAATDLGVPVLSEDRRVLVAAKALGLPCFNAAMLLNLLILRGVISSDELRTYRSRLYEIAWYSEHIRAFADACRQSILASCSRTPFHGTEEFST